MMFSSRLCHLFVVLPGPVISPFEPSYEKTGFLHMRKQRRRSTAQLISAFVFATWIVQSLFYLNPKFQAPSHLLCVYSLVCVGHGRKPRRPVFSQRGSFCRHIDIWLFFALLFGVYQLSGRDGTRRIRLYKEKWETQNCQDYR